MYQASRFVLEPPKNLNRDTISLPHFIKINWLKDRLWASLFKRWFCTNFLLGQFGLTNAMTEKCPASG